MPMPFQPMLASNRAPRRLTGSWVLEPKFDGWRVIVAVDGDVRVWTRNGHELTERLPELAALADAINAPVVLDGELVAGQGRANDFYNVMPAVAASSGRAALTFIAFDALMYGDEPLIDKPYHRRHAFLDSLGFTGPAWCSTPQLLGSVVDVLTACDGHDVEGIVAKRVDSRYRPGARSADWIKVKTTAWRSLHAPRRHEH